jgi:hypothetical protein
MVIECIIIAERVFALHVRLLHLRDPNIIVNSLMYLNNIVPTVLTKK